MILLQSNDKFDQVAMLDPATGQCTWYSKRQTPNILSHPIRGHVAYLDHRLVILFRDNGVLHLRIDGIDFELTDNTQIDLVRGAANILVITRDNVLQLKLTYNPPVIMPPLDMDPTPFVEEEDFDFGVFIYNLMRDPDRRNRIYTR